MSTQDVTRGYPATPASPGDQFKGRAMVGRKSVLMGLLTSGFVMANAAQAASAAGTIKPIAATLPAYITKWAPGTAYVRGQQVVLPCNDVVSASVAHTSSSAYTADTAKWTLSPTFASKAVETVVASGRLSDTSLAEVYADKVQIEARSRIITPLPAGADNLASLQAAVNSAATGGVPLELRGVFPISGTLLLPSHVIMRGGNGGGQAGGLTRITYTGPSSATTAVIGPANRNIDTVNWSISGMRIDTGSLAGIALELYRVSYSRFTDLLIVNGRAGGVGVLLDSNVINATYFNAFEGCKTDGLATGVRFQRGANANMWTGGKICNGGTGMEFLSDSSGNIVTGTDFEDNSVKHIYLGAGANVFSSLHMESAPIGYDIAPGSNAIMRTATTFAPTVLTYVKDGSNGHAVLDQNDNETFALQVGWMKLSCRAIDTTTQVGIDPTTFTGTASSLITMYRNVTTSGAKQIKVCKGDGTATQAFMLDISNTALSVGDVGLGGGKGVFGMANRVTAPATTPTGGGVLYVESGALKYKGSSGTVTVLGVA